MFSIDFKQTHPQKQQSKQDSISPQDLPGQRTPLADGETNAEGPVHTLVEHSRKRAASREQMELEPGCIP